MGVVAGAKDEPGPTWSFSEDPAPGMSDGEKVVEIVKVILPEVVGGKAKAGFRLVKMWANSKTGLFTGAASAKAQNRIVELTSEAVVDSAVNLKTPGLQLLIEFVLEKVPEVGPLILLALRTLDIVKIIRAPGYRDPTREQLAVRSVKEWLAGPGSK